MKAREIYGIEDDNNSTVSIGDYQPILDSFGKIVIQDDDDDYSGDTRVLYDVNGKFGYLCFGWGSCSGCDALQACSTLDEVDDLIDELRDDIIWFDSRSEAAKWFGNHDWQGDFSYSPEFVQNCLNWLANV